MNINHDPATGQFSSGGSPGARFVARLARVAGTDDDKTFEYPMPDGHTLAVHVQQSHHGRKAKYAIVDFRDSRGFRNYEWKNQLGIKNVRRILADVKPHFPLAERLIGQRVSGAARGPAGKGPRDASISLR